MEEKLFWVKHSRLENVFNAMHITASNLFSAYKVKNDELVEAVCKGILRDFLRDYHFGTFHNIQQNFDYYLGRRDAKNEQFQPYIYDLMKALEVLYDIARIHFDIFKELEKDGGYEESLNFTNYLLKDSSFISDLADYAKDVSDSEDYYSTERYEELQELLTHAKKAYLNYDPNFNYPEENESIEDYLERVK